MSGTAVRAEGLAKMYRIGENEPSYRRLTESISNGLRRLVTRRSTEDEAERYVWALRDVSFEVQQGEAVGIIGRNGAGKSTLLKILSRVTAPTEGFAELHGRVGALLEVGTGFHPELSGRENIFLNGAVLGMRRKEIIGKLDEIVAFADVSRFLDTPVKRYSSGMFVRLAFAVAAHLEPDILIVDEVLAVGDTEFQRKCLGRMEDVAHGGRTVLFVSHNLGAVTRLCQRAVWLDGGQVRLSGSAEAVVAAYLESTSGSHAERTWEAGDEPAGTGVRIHRVSILSADGAVSPAIDIRRGCAIEVEYELVEPIRNFAIGMSVLTADGIAVFSGRDHQGREDDEMSRSRGPGRFVSRVAIPGNLLNQGRYAVTVGADIPLVENLVRLENVVSFDVVQTGGVAGTESGKWAGIILPPLEWDVESLPSSEPVPRRLAR